MKRWRLAVLLALLLTLTAIAMVRFWPTRRYRALVRIEELDGRYFQQQDHGRSQNSVLLAYRPVTEQDLVAMQALRPVHRLYLLGSPISDKSLVVIGLLPELEQLDLRGTQVTDDGLVHLRGLSHLEVLLLTNTRVTDRGLVCLRDLPALKFVGVVGTGVTEGGARQLQRLHPGLVVALHVESG